jgi:hypothetical protein
MDYYEIDEKRILALMDGLSMIERLNAEKAADLGHYLYGITTDPGVLSAAKEAIMEGLEEYYDEEGQTTLSEEDIALGEVGLAIPLSSDAIYALFSRHGIDVKGLDYCYASADEKGEGIRDGHFYPSLWVRATVNFGSLRHPVLAEDSFNLKHYMAKYKSGQPMAVIKKLQREEPATMPAAPAAPQALPAGTPITGSVNQIRKVVENFLDRRR